MNSYYKIVIAELKSLGFYFFRQGKGSHEIYTNDRITVSVPVNMKSRHTANDILKDAGSKVKI